MAFEFRTLLYAPRKDLSGSLDPSALSSSSGSWNISPPNPVDPIAIKNELQ